MKTKTMTDAQFDALDQLAWSPETWWHDVTAGARDVLLRNGWLREVRKVACGTRGHKHPGYVTASAKGVRALEIEKIRRGLKKY